MRMIRKQTALLLIGRKFQWSGQKSGPATTLVGQNLSQEQRTLQFCEGWKVRRVGGKPSEASTGCFTRFKERSHLHNLKAQKWHSKYWCRATASYTEDLVEMIRHWGAATPEWQIFDADEAASLEEDAIGLSYLESRSMLGSKTRDDSWPSC